MDWQAAHQRTNAGKMGTRSRETKSSGGGPGATGTPVSGHAGTTGRSRSAVMDEESAEVLVFEETLRLSPVYRSKPLCKVNPTSRS